MKTVIYNWANQFIEVRLHMNWNQKKSLHMLFPPSVPTFLPLLFLKQRKNFCQI